MPEKPAFDPNKPYNEPVIKDTTKPAFNPNKGFMPIENKQPDTQQAYLDALQGIDRTLEPTQKKAKTEEIINAIPDISENEKQMVKNLALKGTSTADISNSILTLQGKHPAQFGHKGYYIKDGKPIPLPKGYIPKDEKLAATIFSEKSLPEELTSSFERGAIKLAQGIARTPEFLFDAAMEENFNKSMNVIKRPDLTINSTKLGDVTGIHNEPAKYLEQVIEKRQADFDNVYDKGITEYVANGEYSKAAGLLANSIAESAPTTIALALSGGGTAPILAGGAVFGAQKKSELDKEATNMSEADKIGIATANGLLEGIFEQFGITKLGGIAKDIFAKEGKDVAKKFVEDAFKETYKGTVGKYLGITGEEALSEMATQFSQNAVDKYSGYKPELDLMQGVIDAGIVGLGAAAGPSVVASKSEKGKIEKANEQSRYIYNKVKEGSEAVTAFKAEIDNAEANGLVSKEEAEKAKFQADVYSEYHEQTNDLKLDEEDRRKVYDYTFQKSNLIDQIKAVDKDKLNGIELAKYHGLEKQAKDLQSNIDELILKAQLKDETTISDTTIDKQAKDEQKPSKEEKKPKLTETQQAIKDKYKKQPEPEVGKYDDVKYEDIPLADFNSEKFNARVKHAKLADYLETIPDKKLAGKLVEKKYTYNNKQNSTYAVQLPDGKVIKLASSMERPEKFRGHMRTEHLIDAKDLVGFPVGVKVEYLPEGKKVIKLYNGKTGKFISWAKETNRGLAKPSELQVEQLSHLETVNEPPISGDAITVTEIPLQPNPNLDVQANNENTEESTINRTESTKGDNNQVISKVSNKAKALVTGTKKAKREIKDPRYKRALSHEVFTPHELAMQYFIGGGQLNPESIKKLFKGSKAESNARISYKKIGAPTIEQIAEQIVNANEALQLDMQTVVNAVEDVVISNNHPTTMAEALNAAHDIEGQKYSEAEIEMMEGQDIVEEMLVDDEIDNAIDILEGMSDEELIKLADEQNEFNNWYEINENKIIENESDIIGDDGEGDQFQKEKPLDYKSWKRKNVTYRGMGEVGVENGGSAILGAGLYSAALSNKSMAKGYGELYFAVNARPKNPLKFKTLNQWEIFLGNTLVRDAGYKSKRDFNAATDIKTEVEKLGYDGVEILGREIVNYKPEDVRYFKTEQEVQNYFEDNFEQQQRQKGGKGNVEVEHHEKVLKVISAMQKALPNIEFKYNKKLKAAGVLRASGKTIEINPYYAGLDTPIHEAGHVLIDAMGYNNPVIQAAFKQLKNTKLADETKQRYPELSEEMLNKEILAEAIGREGAGIFDTEAQKSRFKQLLDYIFTWFKNKLGLNKNVAKSLAKQIIGGIGTKDIGGTKSETDQEQKPKSEDDFNKFREKQLGRNIADENKDLEDLDKDISEAADEETKDELEDIKQSILDQQEADKEAYEKYLSGKKDIAKIADAKTLKNFTLDELVENYNLIRDTESYGGDETLTVAKERIARFLEQSQIEFLEKAQPKLFDKAQVNKKDLSPLNVWVKALADISEKFPAVQALSKEFNDKVLEMVQERNKLKAQHERLGKAVIKEYNKKRGIKGIAESLFSSNSARYFEYLDKNGRYLTDTEAKKANLSKAQIDYLNFMKELNKMRGQIYDENDNLIQDAVIKTDKGFLEKFGEKDGGLAAVSYALGGGNNLDVEVQYTNPNTGKKETDTYQNAQKTIIDHAYKKGGNKAIALGSLLKLAYKAKKEQKVNQSINYRGELTSKFDEPYEGDSYSKDFYAAGMRLIDDVTHVSNMNKLIPLFDSVQYLYDKGLDARLPNIAKFVEDELQSKIYQREAQTDPILDNTLKFFRNLSSKTTMAFNVAANAMNVFIGNYNAWRESGLAHWLKGNKRLFGKDGLNMYSIDLLKKYDVVNTDYDSNPKIGSGLFDKLAYAGGRWGEIQIQGSDFLGRLSDEEFDSFEYNKDGELVVKKGKDEKALLRKMNEYKNEVASIQGKYDERDRRKFMRGEIGKNIAQYKTWIADYWRTRFAEETIDKYGNVHRGSWNMFTDAAMQEIKNDFSKENNYGITMKNGIPTIKNKQIAANLRGAMTVATFLIAMNAGDDEDKKNKQFEQLSLDNTLGNLLFIFDPNNAEYLVSHPLAIQGTISNFLKALDGAIKGDNKKFEKYGTKLLPYRKLKSDIELVTGKDKK